MSNMNLLMKKEFSDLVTNPVIIFVLITFLVYISGSVIYIHELINNNVNSINIGFSIVGELILDLTKYGSIVALMIGFSSIANERISKSLNTLLVKPIYRDTIINSKILTSACFIAIISIMSSIIYISFLLISSGPIIYSMLSMLLDKFLLALFVSLIYMIIFLEFSILISIKIKNQSIALIFSLLTFFFITVIMPSVSFAGNLSVLFGVNQDAVVNIIGSIEPSMIINTIMDNIFKNNVSIYAILNNIWTEIFKLFLFIIILVFISYSSFIKEDIE